MGFEFDKVGQKKKMAFRAWMPALGLILAGTLGFIAYAVGPSVADWLGSQSANFPPAGVDPQLVDYGTTAVVFIVLLMSSWGLVALFAPRSRTRVSEKEMLNSRKEILDGKKSRKKQRDRIVRENAERLRKKSKAKK